MSDTEDDDDLDARSLCSCSSDEEESGNFRQRHKLRCPRRLGHNVSRAQMNLIRNPRHPSRSSNASAADDLDWMEEDCYDSIIPNSSDLEAQGRVLDLSVSGRGSVPGRIEHVLTDKKVKEVFNGGIQIRESRVNLLKPAGSFNSMTRLSNDNPDVMAALALVMDELISEGVADAEPGDRFQIIVHSNVMPAPVSTPVLDVKYFSGETALLVLKNYVLHYDTIDLGDNIQIETVLIRKKDRTRGKGKRGTIKFPAVKLKPSNSLKCMVAINNVDDMCLARAIVVCISKNNIRKMQKQYGKSSREYKRALCEFANIRRGTDNTHPLQKHKASELCEMAGICGEDEDENGGVIDEDVLKVAQYLDKEIKIISDTSIGTVTSFGRKCDDPTDMIYLYKSRVFHDSETFQSEESLNNFSYHYEPIVNIKSFRRTEFYCCHCDIGSDIAYGFGHKCSDKINWCFTCWSRNCDMVYGPLNKDEVQDSCMLCQSVFQSRACQIRHAKLNICDIYFCDMCRQTFRRQIVNGQLESKESFKRKHTCTRKCRVCKDTVEGISLSFHKCFMKRENLKKPSTKYMFIDFETDQSRSDGKHIPIYCFVKWITGVDDVSGEFQFDEREFGVGFQVEKAVGEFIFKREFKDYTIIAHNMRGYDGCFLLRYLHEMELPVSIVSNGLKLMHVQVTDLNIRLIDSLNFLQMSLAEFPKTLGLGSIGVKGYFPHFFTTANNFNYLGPIPDVHDYGVNDMKPKVREEFLQWHAEQRANNVQFDFQRDIRIYCKQDVEILMRGCLAFRDSYLSITKSIRVSEVDEQTGENDLDIHGICDPFTYTTAPGMCAAIYKSKFLPRDSIAQILPSGYENQKYSSKSIEYLEYMRQTSVPNLKHMYNSGRGEVKLLSYRVDGFDISNCTIYEFYGCYWHGCPKCIKKLDSIHPVRQISFRCLQEHTYDRETKLKALGYNLVSIWECEWNEMRKREDVKKIIDTIHVKGPLNPRNAFYGGRTETGKLIYKKTEDSLGLCYADIISLYPSVNVKEEYPVGHPKIILSNFTSLDDYFGVIQCKLLPPKRLLYGPLPYRDAKLLFPLCRTCVENMQTNPCNHNDEERCLYGEWVTEEVKNAVKKGFKVMDIYCVQHFERRSRMLFSDYIKLFYKIKVAASGRPNNCTDTELDEFIQAIEMNDGVTIDKNEFEYNPGKRSGAKLGCNSLWGRFGMKDNRNVTTSVYDLNTVNKMLDDETLEIISIRKITDKSVCVVHKYKSIDFADLMNATNIYIAIFTTAYARMRLYDLIEKVGDRFVYCDTDSIIYEKSAEASQNLPTGIHLGDLSNELAFNDVIVNFVSGGPKVYGYETMLGKLMMKIKGFHLSYRNSVVITIENLERIIRNYVENNLDPATNRVCVSKELKKQKQDLRQTLYNQFHGPSKDKSSAVATNNAISIFNVNRIKRNFGWELFADAEQKIYTYNCDKRIVLGDFSTLPYGYVE